MKKLCSPAQLKSFKSKYESISKLELPLKYLKSEEAYGFYNKGELIAGFILGQTRPYRTLQTFVEAERVIDFQNLLKGNHCVEVCCFWMKRTIRKNKLFNLKVWLKMAWTVHRRKESYVIYGTNIKGLAKMYGYPKNSLLIHQGQIKNSSTFVFITRRKDLFLGTLKIIQMKIRSKVINPSIENNSNLQNIMLHELST